ncbi:MAG TPA: glycosyl hydrolase family 18 protein [Janthinobacterium sp.]|nr:glycosyl hydrolase family 18 protein [Janthinobacterium sp.]
MAHLNKVHALFVSLAGGMLAACGGGSGNSADQAVQARAVSQLAAAVSCPAWVSTQIYTVGNCISYQGVDYTAKWWTQGDVPGADQWGPWAAGSGTPAPTGPAPTPTPVPIPTVGREIGSYFAQWGVYGRNYEVADIHTTQTAVGGVMTSMAEQLSFINYAFGNVYAKNGGYECDMVSKAETGATVPPPADAGTGGDAYADYQRSPARTVDGKAIAWDAPLSGNFAQLKLLKAAHPHLKVFISLGGWSWSKFFSAASQTDALRKQLAKSCVKQFIAGDLPLQDGRGGVGAAKGVFDGIDIDWEYPGGGGQSYNTVDAVNDKHNFTLLMAEFRAQLDAQGALDGRRYALTAAIGAGTEKIAQTEPALYAQSMDWVNVMSYDFHGAWESKTNFHAPLYHDAADPSTGVVASYNANDAIQALVNAGMPRSKILLGVPFYGRGWQGVAAGPNGNGLYQAASGGAAGTYETGINDYKVLITKTGSRWYHPVTKELYLFTSGGEWWSYDDPTVIASKMQFVRDQSLHGAFSWELDGDASGTLTNAVWSGR